MKLGKLWKEKWVDVSGTLGEGDTALDSWNALIASRVELDRFLISARFISHATRRNVWSCHRSMTPREIRLSLYYAYRKQTEALYYTANHG